VSHQAAAAKRRRSASQPKREFVVKKAFNKLIFSRFYLLSQGIVPGPLALWKIHDFPYSITQNPLYCIDSIAGVVSPVMTKRHVRPVIPNGPEHRKNKNIRGDSNVAQSSEVIR
jgi:hypothetical protein